MELRHLRYFVGVAEEHGFARAARRLNVAQPALSKQIHDLETELGVALFERLPRGVRLTRAGEAFFIEARNTLDGAVRAIATARGASEDRASTLRFAHGELSLYAATLEGLLATFRGVHPEVKLRVSSQSDAEIYRALRERTVDVACIFLARYPVTGFGAHRLIDCATTGVLLPASHPLAAKPSVRLPELQTLTWLHSASQRWPGFLEPCDESRMARLGPDRRQLRADRRRDMAQPGQPHPQLRIERQRVLAFPRHRPPCFEHRHHATDFLSHSQPIGQCGDPVGLLPRGDDFALEHERARIRAEGQEGLDLPLLLTPQRGRRFHAQARQRPPLEAMPHVVLEGCRHTVERPID